MHPTSPPTPRAPRYGLPPAAHVIHHRSHTVGYCPSRRVPIWVYEILNASSTPHKSFKKPKAKTFQDRSLPPHVRAGRVDYKNSGFTMGHLAAAGNHRDSREAHANTFILSNIVPQVQSMNNGPWNNLEIRIRELTQSYNAIHIITGPLFMPRNVRNGHRVVSYKVIGNNVAVPTHLFKIVLAEINEDPAMLVGFIMPNREFKRLHPLLKYRVALDKIEEFSGLQFFKEMPTSVLDRLKADSLQLLERGHFV